MKVTFSASLDRSSSSVSSIDSLLAEDHNGDGKKKTNAAGSPCSISSIDSLLAEDHDGDGKKKPNAAEKKPNAAGSPCSISSSVSSIDSLLAEDHDGEGKKKPNAAGSTSFHGATSSSTCCSLHENDMSSVHLVDQDEATFLAWAKQQNLDLSMHTQWAEHRAAGHLQVPLTTTQTFRSKVLKVM
jgi:hypothetical protein